MVSKEKENNKPKVLKLSAGDLVQEQSGNIKDFYKISSCIGRGKHNS